MNRAEEREAQAQYYAAVSFIDEGVGRLLDELEAQGLREDTLIVYTSDHGLNCGHHGIWGKGNGTLPLNMVEESIRIPLIMSYPVGMPAGRRVTVPATGADIAPTILDYCGVNPLPQFHGHSLRSGTGGECDDEWAFCENREGYSCFRSHEWKVAYDPTDTPVMVFNLEEDPGEFFNLLESSPEEQGRPDPRAIKIAQELKARIPPSKNSHWKKQ